MRNRIGFDRLLSPLAGAAFVAILSGCAVRPAPPSLPVVPYLTIRPAPTLELAQAHFDSAQALQGQSKYLKAQTQLERSLAVVSRLDAPDSASFELARSVLGAMRYNLPYSLAAGAPAEFEFDGNALLDSLDRIDLAAGSDSMDSASLSKYRMEAMLDTNLSFDLPVEINDRVLTQLRTFKERVPSHFQRWLERKGRWEAEFSRRLAERGMPQDLVYLAMIESGFNSRATSPAAAAGIWQFIPSTGRRYGLRIDRFVDERRDPWRATDAALDFLETLYKRFGDWKLAMAAYNCGEGCVDRAIRKAGHKDYWTIPIPQETRNYVPRVFAAAILGKRPQIHGFQYTPWEPLVSDTFTVEGGIPLAKIAEVVGAPAESLSLLNPSLIKATTPPVKSTWVVRLPPGTRPLLDSAYDSLERSFEAPEPIRITHRVRRGETLARIADRYGVSVSSLKSWNRIRGKRVRTGKRLVVYTDDLSNTTLPAWQEPPMSQRREILARSSTTLPPIKRHRVRRGETLSEIARKYGVGTEDLMSWNALSSKRVKAGRSIVVSEPVIDPSLASIPRTQAIRVAGAEEEDESSQEKVSSTPDPKRKIPDGPASEHEIARGETLDAIAQQYSVSVSDLMDWNDLSSSRIRAGDKLTIHGAGKKSASQVAQASVPKSVPPLAGGFHRVRHGETLSEIAQKYGISEQKIRSANDLTGDHIRMGQKLTIPGAAPQPKVDMAKAPASRIEPRKESASVPPVSLANIKTVTYTVRPGDTLYSIARARSTTVDTLKQINGMSKPDLRVGQVIKVPHAS
ncbi:MAG: LysM peptidoglycan-binding domain-containing protein [Fibrobacteria bacterium]|nr:LysM peptidoglycan-binding domain-containing protein [Fibrobacteria bacterium]